jgi:hypothetical protein
MTKVLMAAMTATMTKVLIAAMTTMTKVLIAAIPAMTKSADSANDQP